MGASAGLVGLVLYATLTLAVADKQCDVSVLFESHCPDSKNFIHKDLVPMWHKLEQHCSLDLVPFGKARSTATGFSCQHGEKECRGNMVMSCAFNRLPAGRKQLDFASCFMGDPDFGGPGCAESSGVQWEDIESCMQSGEGTRLQKEAEAKSSNIQTSRFVPTVVINKTYNPTDQNDAVRGNFASVMCRYINNPEVCS